MRKLCVWMGVAVLGCGSSGDPNNDKPDAGGNPDTTAPAVVSATPVDTATGVPLTATVELILSEPLDPATVDRSAVSVVDHNGNELRGAVSWDAERLALVFTPARGLARDRDYTVRLGAVRDPAGNQADAFELGFSSVVNAEQLGLVYRMGDISQVRVYQLDADGRQVDLIRYTDAGLDGDWQTSDDVGGNRTTWQRSGRALQAQTQYNDAGDDGMFGTADDVIASVTTYGYDELGRITGTTVTNGPGTDSTWGTADDDIQSYTRYTYEGDAPHEATFTSYVGPGTDATWLTADDEVDYRDTSTYQGGLLASTSRARGAGSDGTWGTADDEIEFVQAHEYGVDRVRTRLLRYDGAGTDGTWGTSDDQLDYYSDYVYGDELDRVVHYAGAGPDQVWPSSDDVATEVAVTDADDRGLTERTRFYANPAGVEEVDEDLETYTATDRADSGSITGYRSYNGAGTDGTWFTGDDVPASDYTCDSTR